MVYFLSYNYVLHPVFHPSEYLFCLNLPPFSEHVLQARAKQSGDLFTWRHKLGRVRYFGIWDTLLRNHGIAVRMTVTMVHCHSTPLQGRGITINCNQNDTYPFKQLSNAMGNYKSTTAWTTRAAVECNMLKKQSCHWLKIICLFYQPTIIQYHAHLPLWSSSL